MVHILVDKIGLGGKCAVNMTSQWHGSTVFQVFCINTNQIKSNFLDIWQELSYLTFCMKTWYFYLFILLLICLSCIHFFFKLNLKKIILYAFTAFLMAKTWPFPTILYPLQATIVLTEIVLVMLQFNRSLMNYHVFFLP